MSRSGYNDGCEGTWAGICWRGAVASATRGKRGQAFFKELLTALDDMPVKELIREELEYKGQFCTLGVIGHARGMDMSKICPYEPNDVALEFNIAEALAAEIAFMNDEYGYSKETPQARWDRMRTWVECQIIKEKAVPV